MFLGFIQGVPNPRKLCYCPAGYWAILLSILLSLKLAKQKESSPVRLHPHQKTTMRRTMITSITRQTLLPAEDTMNGAKSGTQSQNITHLINRFLHGLSGAVVLYQYFCSIEGLACGSTNYVTQWHLVSLSSKRT